VVKEGRSEAIRLMEKRKTFTKIIIRHIKKA